MLLSFRTANHRSIRDEQQLLMLPPDSEDHPDPGAPPAPLRVAGVFGANASGKSNVLDALNFMVRLVRFSMRDNEPDAGIARHPFALSAESRSAPSSYVVDLLLGGEQHSYGVAIDDHRVLEEWLTVRACPGGKPRTVFERTLEEYRFDPSVPASTAQVRDITEENILFLTVAARSRQEAVHPVYDWFQRLRFRNQGPERPSLFDAGFHRNTGEEEVVEELERLLRAADTGIERLELKRQEPVPEETAETEEAFTGSSEKQRELRLRRRGRTELLFHHRSGEDGTPPLSLEQQSHGTRTILYLGRSVLSALDSGSLLLVDELESHLHPHLSAKIIELFADPRTNPAGTQLVFSSHDTALLGWIRGQDVLRRDEIWFTEKDEAGATRLFPLSEYEEQEGEDNRTLWYLTGRYGAVPEVADTEFDTAARPGEERNGSAE